MPCEKQKQPQPSERLRRLGLLYSVLNLFPRTQLRNACSISFRISASSGITRRAPLRVVTMAAAALAKDSILPSSSSV